jgi:RNA polymerase sigma-70 factor, ECF subfamily
MSELQVSLPSVEIGFPFGIREFPEAHRREEAISEVSPGPSFATGNVFADVGEELGLIHRANLGDSDALNQLFARHMPRLLRIALRMLRSQEDAEDAVQDALLRAHRNLSSFQNRCLFSTWVTRIVINSALMMRRRKRVRPEVSLEETLQAEQLHTRREVADSRPDPEQLCASAEVATLVEKAMGQLSPGLETAVRLREMDGLSTAESTALLGIQPSAFKSRISRARHQLQALLRPALECGCRVARDHSAQTSL